MKKKIILTLVLSTIAMLILCAAALAEMPCNICASKGESGTFVISSSGGFSCNFECNNCGARGSTVHSHGEACDYCGKTFGCQFSYFYNGDGTHTYRCNWNTAGGCPDKTETKSACSGGEANCVSPGYCQYCRGAYLPKDENKHNISEWNSNGDDTHTRSCTNYGCTKSETANCSGGKATCINRAVCDVCKSNYGDVSSSNHGEFTQWFFDTDQHYRYCEDCARPETYQYEDHTGGTATCVNYAVCDVCKGTYGEIDTTNHGEFTPWVSTNTKQHVRYCKDCARPETYQYEDHTGGTVTCNDYAVCDVCKSEYGEIERDKHDLKTTRIEGTETHITVCLNGCGYSKTEDCSGGKGTCLERAVCTGCGEAYGELASKNGHYYRKKAAGGNCTTRAYIRYECKYCGDSYTEREKTANLHWFDLWTDNGDETHSAPCKRENCKHTGKTACTFCEVTIGENIFSVCLVCGSANFAAIEDAEITGENLPKGEAIVRGAEKPFEGALYAFTAAFEYSGKVEEFNDAVTVTIPVSIEDEFKLLRADEAQTELPYTLEEGKMTFETESSGLFIIVPTVEEAA